jgi:hypothetical protein
MRRAGLWVVALLIAAALTLAACSPDHPESGKSEEEDPARVTRVEGSDLKSVTLTAHAAERIGIRTEPVRELSQPGGGAPVKSVPLAALIYDKSGDSWVFVATQPRTFVRQRVIVARVEDQLVFLESGPAAGTAVVTVGGAELLGSEYGVGGQ